MEISHNSETNFPQSQTAFITSFSRPWFFVLDCNEAVACPQFPLASQLHVSVFVRLLFPLRAEGARGRERGSEKERERERLREKDGESEVRTDVARGV